MRKTKISIKGTVILNNSGKPIECSINNLGNLLKPNFGGMLNATLINNRLFIMELQNEGFKVSKTFHYRNSKDKIAQSNDYIERCKQSLIRVLKDNYQCIPVNFNLYLKEEYDVDYCELPLEEMKADLNTNEIQKVIQDMATYKPTIQTQRKINVFFG